MKNILVILFLWCSCGVFAVTPNDSVRHYVIEGAGITVGKYMTSSDGLSSFSIEQKGKIPFSQQCIVQTKEVLKKVDDIPYMRVREALPIPSCYTPTEQGVHAGLADGVYHHLHSAGMDILPNGDILAIYFSTPVGKAEADTSTTFVQARLRYGSDEWDMPELLFKTRGGNDQSALIFTDKDTVWFFGGGRNLGDGVPFRILRSTDNGQTWTLIIPQMDHPLTAYMAQPITTAFRNEKGELFVAIDGKGPSSLLLRSQDGGYSWHDMGGRTSSRHSAIVPLDDEGNLLSIGGKNNGVNGWNAQNISHDWGATWESPTQSPFPPLGTAQRPCIIRLHSGALLVVGDSYMHKKKIAPPAGWKYGNGCYVALSRDNGKTWKIRILPVTLPQHHRVTYPSLGYVTLRQGHDGMIHILTTTNYPGIHIEFNEAWLSAEENAVETSKITECLSEETNKNGRFITGKHIEYYPNGKKHHEVVYKHGRRTGLEILWREDGTIEWQWERDLTTNVGVWTQYWNNGQKRIESTWNLRPTPRDLPEITINGCVAEGKSRHWDRDGRLIAEYTFHNGIEDGDAGNESSSGIQNEGK